MTALLRTGTKVHTIDRGARVHNRQPDKPEAVGTIRDHHRPFGRHSKERTPPYYVVFENGDAAWYDALEVEPFRSPRKKTVAQLNHEIAEILASPPALLIPTNPRASEPRQSPFEEAKAEQALLEEEVDVADTALKAFPRGPMGLVPDVVKSTPEYQAAKARFQKAFARQREFNTVFTKRFAKELRAERAERTRDRGRAHGSH